MAAVTEVAILKEIETAINNADLITMAEDNLKEIAFRTQAFKELVGKDEEQAIKYQTKLAEFETEYFKQYLEYSKSNNQSTLV